MEKQQILQADYLDILFDDRNKSYGSYDLRKKYPDRARRAVLGVLLSVSVICAVPVIASNFNKGAISSLPGTIETPVVTNVYNAPKQPKPAPKQLPPIKQPAIKQPAAIAATKAFTPPRIVENDKVENETPPTDDLKDKMVGTKDNEGDPNGKVADNGQPNGKGDGKEGDINGKSEETIRDFADEMPEFNGDVYSYLGSHTRYPEAAREAGKEGKVFLQFVVDETGSISDVEVIRSAGKLLDAEAVRVVSSMPKWKPGKVKGKAVKVYFKLPITFQLA